MDVAGFFDPVGLGIVFGGTAAVAAMRSTRGDMAGALAAVRPLFTADPHADGLSARVAVGRIERIAEARDLCCVDRLETTQRFLRRIARRLSETGTAADFARWCADELEDRRARHAAVQAVWRAAADAAPAMGLVGTVIGLIRMFAAMDDPARIGPAMAMAMLTTLYGVVLANLIAGPVAARLERLSEAERAWQRRTTDRLVGLAEAELAPRAPAVPRETIYRQAA